MSFPARRCAPGTATGSAPTTSCTTAARRRTSRRSVAARAPHVTSLIPAGYPAPPTSLAGEAVTRVLRPPASHVREHVREADPGHRAVRGGRRTHEEAPCPRRNRRQGARSGGPTGAYFFLPWVLPGILMTWVFADQRRWDSAPCGRRWSSLATVERPRTAQGRPSALLHRAI